MNKVFSIALLVSVLIAACGVSPIALDATLKGVQSAINGAPGTFVMAKEGMYFLAWPQGEAYGFAVLKASADAMQEFITKAAGTGTRVDKMSISEIYKFLEKTGWALSEVPPEIRIAVQGTAAWLHAFGHAPVILVVPVGSFDNPILQKYESTDG